jgi:hypothetical protein
VLRFQVNCSAYDSFKIGRWQILQGEKVLRCHSFNNLKLIAGAGLVSFQSAAYEIPGAK